MTLFSGEQALHDDYAALRTRTGQPVTVLRIDADRTRVASGSGEEPEAILTLDIGFGQIAATHFRHAPPSAAELEDAIMAVEDALAPARARIVTGSTLFCTGAALGEIASLAGATGQVAPVLSREAVERLFDRLSRVALGRPAAAEGLPAGADFAASLLILREFSHHMDFPVLTLVPGC